jgi:O-antigen/teichoic acid export membrane protein
VQIGRKDVLWNYAATFLQIAAQILLFPFILRILPQETIAVWTIFSTIIALVSLLDFGFNPSFARNVSYVFSGVKSLKTTGFYTVEGKNTQVDYGLMKGLINVMRLFYSRMAIILLFILATLGTYYIYTVLKAYSGNQSEIYIAWIILGLINSYSFYTLYYDALLQGMGLIKRAKQITIIGQSVYLVAAIILILTGFGLIAIVSAQALSVIIRRVLSYYSIYTVEIKRNLRHVVPQSKKDILKAIYPNAVKVGLTGIGSFLVSRSAIIIGSLYLPLDIIASYGITTQIIGIIAGISMVYFSTYQPKIVQYRVENDIAAIKQLYLKGCLILWAVYIAGGVALIFLGDWVMNSLIKSKTPLLGTPFIIVAVVISLLENNHGIAGNILLTKNEVPFFKAALVSGSATLLLLFIFLGFVDTGVLGMILAPGIAQGCYQNWKWPKVVIKELKIKKSDIYFAFVDIIKFAGKIIK